MCCDRVCIDLPLHYVQFPLLYSCTQQVRLGWDFIAKASASICCRQLFRHMAEYSLPADDASLRWLAVADSELPLCHQRSVAIASNFIARGDVVVQPSAHCFKRGIAFASGLVWFVNGSTFVSATNPTSQKILVTKGTMLAYVTK